MSLEKTGSKEHIAGEVAVLKEADKVVYDLIGGVDKDAEGCAEYHKSLFASLAEEDREVYELIGQEYQRVCRSLRLVAAENQCSKAVLAALGSVVQNKTAEGFAGGRFHGGCEVVDRIENLAVSRAKKVFSASYANVQPHSGTSANQIVLSAVLEPGDKILSLGVDHGGHESHGAECSFADKFFDIENYYVDRSSFLLDYDAIEKRTVAVKPKLIICGVTAYSRAIDFARFRQIADLAGAYLLADVSHIFGLIAAGAHQSSIDYAHFTTTSTYKAGGPRGGLILMGADYDKKIKIGDSEVRLCEYIEKMTFPGVQGTPYMNHIAAKAVFFREMGSSEYHDRQFSIIENAQRLARNFVGLGYDVLTGGTDNHMVLINVANFKEGLTGPIAQKCLEDCRIIVKANKLAYDEQAETAASGIRLGTLIVTKQGLDAEDMDIITELVDSVLRKVEITGENDYRLDASFAAEVGERVGQLCSHIRNSDA